MKCKSINLFALFFLFCVVAGQSLASEPFRFERNDKQQLTLTEGSLPILTYQYGIIEHEHVPQNDQRRFASCYVHPLYGLNGEILTDDAPKDHFHHRGVFWTWPHVGIHEPGGTVRTFDLWHSNTPLRQHFIRWIDKTITDETAAFEVENGWFIGDPEGGDKVMNERVRVIVHRIQQVGDVTSRSVDFEFQWQPTDKPITLRGQGGTSYGGFSVRFRPSAPAERNEINRITVPSGIAAADLTETHLPWAGYTSAFSGIQLPDGKRHLSGAVIFIPKTHPDFPPTWLTRYYGPLCVGWPGVHGRTFQPGETIEVRYRVWIHDGAVTVPQIEKAYGEYAK